MISVVVPTYNEVGAIGSLLKRIAEVLGRGAYEVIIVDDGSPDGTAEVVKKLARKDKKIRLLTHPPPRDLGRAILMGVEAARGEVIVGMDADGNHEPGYIPSLLDSLRFADIAVGSRFVSLNVGSFIFNAFLKFFLGFPIWDNTSGFYAIRRKTLLFLKPSSIYYGYGEYHLRLVYKAMRKGLTITEVPVVYPARIHGQSKSRLGRMLVTYLWTAFQLKSQR